jgi:hypothetical protein
MSIHWRNLFVACILMAVLGCAGGKPARWGHFHGNLSNQGIQRVDSGFALSSSWISKPYRITSSSPVIGTDYQDREILYAGTMQPVFATPGIAAEEFVFVVSKDHIQVLDISDGTLAHDDKSSSKLPLLGVTYTSPAVAANRVYVSTLEMLTVTYDLKARGHDTHFYGNGLSSVAIGSDGAVYGVASDGAIYKYAGTE